jgi:phage-related protein
MESECIVFTHGFLKKDQKIPLEEIRVAQRRVEEYRRRHP